MFNLFRTVRTFTLLLEKQRWHTWRSLFQQSINRVWSAYKCLLQVTTSLHFGLQHQIFRRQDASIDWMNLSQLLKLQQVACNCCVHHEFQEACWLFWRFLWGWGAVVHRFCRALLFGCSLPVWCEEFALCWQAEFEKYLKNMSISGTWGDELTLRAVVEAYGCIAHVSCSVSFWHRNQIMITIFLQHLQSFEL